MRSITLAVAATLLLGGTGHAASPVLEQATDLSGAVIFMESHAPGMVLIAVKGADQVVRGFGETASGNKTEPTGKNLFRLNSTTKVFTTEVLADMAAEGTVRLSDPLQLYAGAAQVPAFDGTPITLLDLATHSAGLPREMGYAPEGVSQRAWPTRPDRWAWLPGKSLTWRPGSAAAYSNIGFDLLADALETAGKKPYPDLLRDKVTAPLSMADTTLIPTREQCGRLMAGSGLAADTPCGDTSATGGSGGLYSSGDDMAHWMAHELTDSAILAMGHAIYHPRQSLTAAIGFDEGVSMAGLGLGWLYVAADGPRPALLTKSGGGAGFMSYMALVPGRDIGVMVVVNKADFGMFAGLVQGVNAIIQTMAIR